jgi:hypothetical protein
MSIFSFGRSPPPLSNREGANTFQYTCKDPERTSLLQNRINKPGNFLNSAYFTRLKQSELLSTPLKISLIYYLIHGRCGSSSRVVSGDISKNRIIFQKGENKVILPLSLVGEMAQWMPFFSYEQLKGLKEVIDRLSPRNNGSISNSNTISDIKMDDLIRMIGLEIERNHRNGGGGGSHNLYGESARSRLPNFGDFEPRSTNTVINNMMKKDPLVMLYVKSTAFAKHISLDRTNVMINIYHFLMEALRLNSRTQSSSPSQADKYAKIVFILSFVNAFPTTNTFYNSQTYTSFMNMVRTSDSGKISERVLYAYLMDYNKSQQTLGIPEEYLESVIGLKKLSDLYQRNHGNVPFIVVAQTYNKRGNQMRNNHYNFEEEIGARTRAAYSSNNSRPNSRPNSRSNLLSENYRNNLINQSTQNSLVLIGKINNSTQKSSNHIRLEEEARSAITRIDGNAMGPLGKLVDFFIGHSKDATGLGSTFLRGVRNIGRMAVNRVGMNRRDFREVLFYGKGSNSNNIIKIQFRKDQEYITLETQDVISIARRTPYLSYNQMVSMDRLLKEFKETLGMGNRTNRNARREVDDFIHSLVVFVVILVPNADLRSHIRITYPYYEKPRIPLLDNVMVYHQVSIQGCEEYSDTRDLILSTYQKIMMGNRLSGPETINFNCMARQILQLSLHTDDEYISCRRASEILQAANRNTKECVSRRVRGKMVTLQSLAGNAENGN